MSNPPGYKKAKLSNHSAVVIHSSTHPSLQASSNDPLTEQQQGLLLPVLQRDPMAFFSEEIALHIFELLSPVDLGKCACVSRLWHRLVNDQMLWRRLFLSYKFVFPRGLNPLGITSRTNPQSQQKVNVHPSRGNTLDKVDLEQSQNSYQYQCWKALYRLNYNWIMGQARVTSVSAQELSTRDQSLPDDKNKTKDHQRGLAQIWADTHSPIVRFKGSVILISSLNGLVHLWKVKDSASLDVSGPGSGQPEYWQTYQSSVSSDTSSQQNHRSASPITCLSLDSSSGKTSQDWQKVMVGYDSGHFSIFEYTQQNNSMAHEDSDAATLQEGDMISKDTPLREIGNTASLPAWSEVGRIVTASFHFPILTTCSADGVISIYMIQEKSSSGHSNHWCRLLHRLYGTSTGSPIGISLEQIGAGPGKSSANSWRALVSFGLELYDGSWTLRLQETEFDERYILRSVETGTEEDNSHQDGEEIETEGKCDQPFPTYFKPTIPGTTSDCIPSAGHVRIGSISSISISWPFVVTTHSDNTLNVFQMTRKSDRSSKSGQKPHTGSQQHTVSSSHKEPLRFQHLSTLYGHCGAVSSVSIESRSGRLVSASMDRSIKVWTMAMKNQEDQLEQQRVHQCVVSMSDINKSWTEGGQVTKEEGLGLIWVGSDDEKIVSMNCDGTVKVWQFS